ncbi:MAG: hypothetical protein J2P29_13695, partial [Actinobacteria bacterium]|nr:hypothetical protein [Actinomycetota bacterium]
MGLMDKVKSQATQFAQESKARLDQAQANRRGDALLRQLGAAVFAQRTGRGSADSQIKIDQLVTSISAHERENGLNLTQATVPQPSSPADEP